MAKQYICLRVTEVDHVFSVRARMDFISAWISSNNRIPLQNALQGEKKTGEPSWAGNFHSVQICVAYSIIRFLRASEWISPRPCDAEHMINFGYP